MGITLNSTCILEITQKNVIVVNSLKVGFRSNLFTPALSIIPGTR